MPDFFTPVDHDPFATPKPGQVVPPIPNQDTMAREAARTVIDMARPYWMDLEPTDREILERSNAMQTGQTVPGKVLPTTGMNPVPFAALDIGSMLPVGGLAKLAGAALGAGAKGALRVGAETAAKTAAEAAPEAAQSFIRAYHGSPHDFERFDLSKIGTGEGAQAYGHGLYFAENEGTARSYRDALSQSVGNQQTAAGAADRFVSLYGDGAADALKREIATMQTQAQKLSDAGKGIPQVFLDRIKNEYEPALEMVTKGFKPGGRMYEVNIAAHPEHFLDWDKPLSEQHPKVQDVLKQFGVAYDKPGMAQFDDALLAALNDKGPATLPKQPNNPVGADIYRNLPRISYAVRDDGSQAFRASTAKTLDEAAAEVGGDKSRVRIIHTPDKTYGSQALRDAGIPGIKYLDQGSRAAGEGSRNYVVFDDKLIDIIKKYGIAGLGIFPAGSQVLFPVDHDPFAQ